MSAVFRQKYIKTQAEVGRQPLLKEARIKYLLICFLLIFISIWRLRNDFVDLTLVSFPFAVFIFICTAKRLPIQFFLSFSFLTVLWCYVTVMSLANYEYNNFTYFLKYSRVVLAFFSTAIIIYLGLGGVVKKKQIHPDVILHILAIVLFMHIIVMVAQLVSQEFYMWSLQFVGESGRYNWWRVRGLMPGTSMGGQLLGIYSIYFSYMAVKFKSVIYSLILITIAPLFLMSAIAGLAPYLVALFYFILFLRCAKIYVLMGLFVLTYFASFFFLGPLFSLELFERAIARLLLLFGDQSVELRHSNPVHSFRKLISSFDLPKNGNDLIFGNIQPSKTDYSTTSTDSGIISNLHALGVVGTSLALISPLVFVALTRSRFLLLFFLCWVMIMFKNDTLYSRVFFDLFFVVFILIFVDKRFQRFFDARPLRFSVQKVGVRSRMITHLPNE